jgi:multiple sugar transport system substrate-binding protein
MEIRGKDTKAPQRPSGLRWSRRRFLMYAAGASLPLAVAPAWARSALAAGPKTTVTVWTYLPEIADYFKGLAPKFTAKNPNVEVQVTLYAQRALDQKLAVALPTGSGPDVIDGGPQRQHFSAGFIEPLPDAMKKFMLQEIKIPRAAQEFATEAGSFYTVPWFVGTQAMYYNKSYFEAAGLTSPPTTVAQMLEYARKLTKRDASGVTREGLDLRLFGGGDGVQEKFWVQAMIPYGAHFLTKVGNKWRAGYDNDAGVEALAMYIDALYKDKVSRLDIKHDAEGFELGLSAMFMRESWVIGHLAKNAPQLKYGVFAMPKGPGGQGMVTFWEGLAVSKASKNKVAAWDFIRFCLSPDAQRTLVDQTGWIPTRTDVDYGSIYAKTPALEVFIKELATPGFGLHNQPPIPEEDEIETRMGARLEIAFKRSDLVGNRVAMRSVIHEMAQETNAILKRNGHLA